MLVDDHPQRWRHYGEASTTNPPRLLATVAAEECRTCEAVLICAMCGVFFLLTFIFLGTLMSPLEDGGAHASPLPMTPTETWKSSSLDDENIFGTTQQSIHEANTFPSSTTSSASEKNVTATTTSTIPQTTDTTAGEEDTAVTMPMEECVKIMKRLRCGFATLLWRDKLRIFKLTMERLCHRLPNMLYSYDELDDNDEIVGIFFKNIREMIPSWPSQNHEFDMDNLLDGLEEEVTIAPRCRPYTFRRVDMNYGFKSKL